MSAASRAREEEQRNKLEAERYKDLPLDSIDESDPEFDRLLAWFIENREGLAEHLNREDVIIRDNRVYGVGHKRTVERLKPVETINYSKGKPNA